MKKAPKKQTARAQGKRSGERSKQEKKGGRKKEKAAAKQSAEKRRKELIQAERLATECRRAER